MIQVSHLSKKFGDFQALSDVTMKIPTGSVYGLVGPNGAGKSTIIRHLTGIYRPDQGTISVDGQPVYENPAVKARIAYVPDDLFYFFQSNTLDMKNYYKGIYPHFDLALFERLKEAFPAIDVKQSIRRLSKGMQKQVIFWLSICCKPDIMILDEPVDGLDPVMRRQIWSILLSEVAERHMTVLVSSHNLRELEDVCDTVGIMFQGQVHMERPLEELQSNISKIQLVFPEEMPSLPDGLQVLHQTSTGHAHTLIVRGDPAQIQEILGRMHPLVLDVLPLTLEEIFIYEMGGMNYEFKDILL
ncbi:MAG: ABC transporter ATP-binding protein [Lachnospiraceae bacterium]|jgi:ABC-2 type transport system ATP-binding protein|nr:ABC transporter ATP-binding protein [Lachnospiraceae bacterium]MCI1656404.1 ABC transporter ATP-binding protein [Lachnospiraceae bacterium]MCI2194886.1 ABC transporter ATP-binding protein [Lachnospiraceae bacterium]